MNKATMYAIIWASTAVAVSIAIYITKSASPLLAMLFPLLITNSGSKEQ